MVYVPRGVCQSILAKTDKTPVIPIKTEPQGIFCILQAILAYLQVFRSVSVALAASRATELHQA